MGLRRRLGDLFWPPELAGEQPDTLPVDEHTPPPPAAPTAHERSGLGARLKRVGVSEAQRLSTVHRPAPVWAGPEPSRVRAGTSLRQRLQHVGVPDLDAKELARRQRILDASREVESRARREAAYEIAAASCPVPIHRELIPLAGDLRLREDEFLVAGSGRTARNRDLTLTTHRLVYTRGREAGAQLVVYLADICDVVFHGNDTLTVGTPSGRWEHLPIAGNSVAASRDRLLALVHHARAQRPAGPGAGDQEARRPAANAETRSRRQRPRQVEIPGRATSRHPASAPDSAALAAPTAPAEAVAQPGEER